MAMAMVLVILRCHGDGDGPGLAYGHKNPTVSWSWVVMWQLSGHWPLAPGLYHAALGTVSLPHGPWRVAFGPWPT